MVRPSRGIALALGAVMACAAPGDAPQRSFEALHAAGAEARIGGATLSVSAEAWRSFQPIRGEAGEPLLALVRVHARGGTVPTGLVVDGVYLLRGDELFSGVPREEQQRERNASVVEYMLRNGPAWAPGDSIDVVVSVRPSSGTTLLLRTPRTTVLRVD